MEVEGIDDLLVFFCCELTAEQEKPLKLYFPVRRSLSRAAYRAEFILYLTHLPLSSSFMRGRETRREIYAKFTAACPTYFRWF